MIYLAHPVAASTKEEVRANAERAGRWLLWLIKKEPERAVVAPWLTTLLLGEDDFDLSARERAIRASHGVVVRCDGVVLVGGRISSGMRGEINSMLSVGGWISDLTSLGDEPPADGISFHTNLLTRVVDSPALWGQRKWAASKAHEAAKAQSA
jgi:hypothetical protein